MSIVLEPDTPEVRYKFNQIYRERMCARLLQDILLDLMICKLEQWDAYEYIDRLKREIDVIAKQFDEKGRG